MLAIARDITRFALVPEDLISRRQWALWRREKDHDGKLTKVPYQISGRKAMANAPVTWTSYSNALETYSLNCPASDGIVFAFSPEDPFLGIDLDNSLDADGNLLAWAEDTYEKFACGYAEISPSGRGLKIWVRGQMPGGRGRKRVGMGDGTGAIEMYDRGRFFTVTGNQFRGGCR